MVVVRREREGEGANRIKELVLKNVLQEAIWHGTEQYTW